MQSVLGPTSPTVFVELTRTVKIMQNYGSGLILTADPDSDPDSQMFSGLDLDYYKIKIRIKYSYLSHINFIERKKFRGELYEVKNYS